MAVLFLVSVQQEMVKRTRFGETLNSRKRGVDHPSFCTFEMLITNVKKYNHGVHEARARARIRAIG